MAEMINRAALIDKLCKKAHEWRGTMTGDIYANVTQMVKRMPYVEVEPHEANESETKKCTCYRTREATRYLYQPYGRWISHAGYDECNLCHTKTVYGSNYCPNCGAKMDLEEE